jgi:hypothetical protein
MHLYTQIKFEYIFQAEYFEKKKKENITVNLETK